MYEQAVSNLDRSMHISLWVLVAHTSFIEGSITTKNTASEHLSTMSLDYKPFKICNGTHSNGHHDTLLNEIQHNNTEP